MRPVFQRSVAIALCGVLASSSLAFAASPERPVLLERLGKSMPLLTETIPLAKTFAMGMSGMLLSFNPGKEALITPLASAFEICAEKAIKDADLTAVALAAVETSDLADDDLLKAATFMEAPETAEFFGFLAKGMRDEKARESMTEPSPNMLKHMEAMGTDPALLRFMKVVKTATEGSARQSLGNCMNSMGAAAESAGLKLE